MNNDLYIVWTPENELGIPIIDEQHRGLVSSINSFHYLIQEGAGIEAVRPTIMMLVQYIDIHFRTEEPLLERANYPDYENHIKLHRNLTRTTEQIVRKTLAEGTPYIALEFLKEWWMNHINNVDRQYAPYVKKALNIRN